LISWPMDNHVGFRIAMQAAGLVPPKSLIDDGRIHRCQVDGKKPSNKSGAYRLTPDGEFGGFENWATGSGWQQWRPAKPSQLTSEQRCAFLAAQRASADKEREERKQAREKARWMWGKAREGGHPYLDRKGICSNGSRVLGELLLVPMMDWDGEIHSVQTITSEGEKRFLKGGRLGGCFHWVRIGEATGPMLYVCEGFATAATVHAATGGKPTVVAFCAANLLPVAKVLREKIPRAVIVVCADNDAKTPGNPGVTAATKAALEVGGRIVIPYVDGGTDFNDVANVLGIAEAKRQLSTSTKPIKVVDEKAERDYPGDSPARRECSVSDPDLTE
jgi:putative DNA primase/helicase